MKYTIDEMTPDEGQTLKTMIENGEYYLEQVGEYNSLEEAIFELEKFRLKNKNKDYDLRNKDEVIMGVMQGKIFIE